MDVFVGLGAAVNEIVRGVFVILTQWVPAIASVGMGLGGESTQNIRTVSAIGSPVPAPHVPSTLDIISNGGEYARLLHFWNVFVAISLTVCLIELAIIIYAILQTRQIRLRERAAREAIVHPVSSHDIPKTQLRWNHIREQVAGEDEHQWRVAILEADILLNELLDVLGYKGETMGDKLKAVPRAAFNSIDMAWEAHKARNRLAHEGSAYSLSAREARRLIGFYEQVFREHGFIA